MRRTLMGMAVLAGVVLLLTVPRVADARVSLWFGYPGVSIYSGPPVVPVPPVAVVPPYYYGTYYAPPPLVVAPPYWRRPYYGYGPVYRGHKWKGRPPGWVKHGRW
jgi:hypothetical protein